MAEEPGNAEVGRLNNDGQLVSLPLAAFLFWRVAEGDLTGIALTFVFVLILAVLVGVLVGYSWAAYRQSKSLLQREAPESVPLLSLKVEKGRKNLPGA